MFAHRPRGVITKIATLADPRVALVVTVLAALAGHQCHPGTTPAALDSPVSNVFDPITRGGTAAKDRAAFRQLPRCKVRRFVEIFG